MNNVGDWSSYIIYFFAYGASLAAFSFSSIYWLRGLTVFSSLLFMVYYFIYPADPLWMDILAEISMVVLNLVMLLILISKQRKIHMTADEREVFEAFFGGFSKFEFFKLIKKGKWLNLKVGHKIINKDTDLNDVYFLYNGRLNVQLENDKVVELSDGYFVGERSFATQERANADVVVTVPSKVIAWKQVELRDLLKRNPAMKNSFDSLLYQDLAKKLYS